MSWIILLSAMCATIVAQGLLKAGAGSTTFATQLLDWRTIVGLGLYGLAALLYIVALRRMPLSVALPFTALSYLVVAAIGHFVFNEAIGPQRLIALGLIGAGVITLATS